MILISNHFPLSIPKISRYVYFLITSYFYYESAEVSKVTHGWDIPVVAACTAADKVMDGAVVFVT